jgi:hypothetical protein
MEEVIFSKHIHRWNIWNRSLNKNHWIGFDMCEKYQATYADDYNYFWECSSTEQQYKTSVSLNSFETG